MTIKKEIIDTIPADYESPEDLLGKEGILQELTKSLIERALEAELTHHLGYEKNDNKNNKTQNSRNGRSRKTVIGDSGKIDLEIPRDRESSFEPKIIEKRQTRLKGFDDKILSFYSRGMSTREIQAHLEEIYGVDVSPMLISNVIDEVKSWQSRPLEPVYPIVYLDALVIKSREDGHVRNKSAYLALGVNIEGQKELLGVWIANSEGAKFWPGIPTDLKNRFVTDIYIACVDGLKGFVEAIETIFPETTIQLCIVHMVRNSLKFVSWKDRKVLVNDLKKIYTAQTVEASELELDEFSRKWDKKYPMISRSWIRNWDRITPFFSYPEEIRKVIYTTNAIESLNRSLRKVIKTKGVFPNDESILKLLYLSILKISKKWTMPIRNWNSAVNQMAMMYGD